MSGRVVAGQRVQPSGNSAGQAGTTGGGRREAGNADAGCSVSMALAHRGLG